MLFPRYLNQSSQHHMTLDELFVYDLMADLERF